MQSRESALSTLGSFFRSKACSCFATCVCLLRVIKI